MPRRIPPPLQGMSPRASSSHQTAVWPAPAIATGLGNCPLGKMCRWRNGEWSGRRSGSRGEGKKQEHRSEKK